MTPRLADADWNHWPDGLDDAATWAAVAGNGFDGVEIGVYAAEVELAPGRVAALRELANVHDLPVAAILLSLPTERWPGGALTGDQAARERLCALAVASATVAADLGLATLGLWPGADPPDAAPARVADGLRRVAEAVAPTGVRLAVEYKPDTAVPDAAAALALADAVPGTGVLLDTGHAWALGEEPAQVVRRLAAAGVLWHVHLGDAHEGAGDDDLPLGRVHDPRPLWAALEDVGYVGVAALDLYGAVSAGVATGAQAGAESREALGLPGAGGPA